MGFLADLKAIDLICEYLIKSSVVLSFTLFLTFLFRKQSASLRHFLLSVSLIGLLFFPFLSTITTGWETRLLPSWQPWKTMTPSTGQKGEFNDSSGLIAAKSSLVPDKGMDVTGNLSTPRSADPMTAERTRHVLGYCLLGLWSAGLIFLLLRTSLGLCRAMRLTKQGKNLKDPRWRQLLHHFLAVITLKRRVNLLSHENVRIPFTWGVIKPVVIMPDASLSWEDDLRSTALFHELSHIKRGDFLVMILARMSCILYWFNPLSWLAFKSLRKEQEKACDELVLKTGIKPSTYAANLLSLKDSGVWKWNPTVAVLGAVGKSQFNDRLLTILKIKFNPTEVKMKNKILLSLTVGLAVILIGMARPSHSAVTVNIDKSISSEHEHFVETQETKQEKNKAEEQEKTQSEKPNKKESQEKKSKEKDIKAIIVDEKSGHIEIITTKDDKIKKIILEEKPIIILEKDGSVDTLSLTLEGKCWTIKKGGKGHLLIDGDKIILVEGDEKVIKLKKGLRVQVKADEKEDGRKVITVKGPHIVIHKGEKAPEHFTIYVKDKKGDKKRVVVAPHVKVNTLVDLQIKEKILQEKIDKIQEMVQKIVEHRMNRIEALENYEEVVSRVANKEIQEKLEKIFERLSQELESKMNIQEKTLKSLEKSLEKLGEDLEEKSEKLKKIDVYMEEKPVHLKIKHRDSVNKAEKYHISVNKEEGVIIKVHDKEKGYTLIFKSKLSGQQKEAYTKALEKLKSRLPEGYKVESEFDDESNSVCITIKGDDKKEGSKEKLKELLKELKEVLSKE